MQLRRRRMRCDEWMCRRNGRNCQIRRRMRRNQQSKPSCARCCASKETCCRCPPWTRAGLRRWARVGSKSAALRGRFRSGGRKRASSAGCAALSARMGASARSTRWRKRRFLWIFTRFGRRARRFPGGVSACRCRRWTAQDAKTARGRALRRKRRW